MLSLVTEVSKRWSQFADNTGAEGMKDPGPLWFYLSRFLPTHTHWGTVKSGLATVQVFPWFIRDLWNTSDKTGEGNAESESEGESNRWWKSMTMMKTKVVWLKSAGLKSFMRSAKPNMITHTSPDLLPHSSNSFTLFILHWICHSALKYSCPALKNECIRRKELKSKREKLVVSQDALSWWKWQRALSQAIAPGNLDDATVSGGCSLHVWVYAKRVWVDMCNVCMQSCDRWCER